MKPIIILSVVYIAVIFGMGYQMNRICDIEYKKGFAAGYNQYIKDRYIPAPFISKEIPVKTKNPKLISKFKG